MKKYLYLIAIFALLIASMTSCVSSKKIRYYQGADTLLANYNKIEQEYEMRIKAADQVQIKVNCSDADLLAPFRQEVVVGATSYAGGSTGSLGTGYGYTVSSSGDIRVPLLGKIHILNMTCEECADVIEERIKEVGLINDPDVTVRLMNARVTVLGAIRSPQVVTLTSERNTISDILARCSDIDDTGIRYKIQLYREENGCRKMYELDMTKADVFLSPAYYVQQNDLIYILPNKSKGIKSSSMYSFMSAGSSIMAFVSTVTSFVLLYLKYVK